MITRIEVLCLIGVFSTMPFLSSLDACLAPTTMVTSQDQGTRTIILEPHLQQCPSVSCLKSCSARKSHNVLEPSYMMIYSINK